MSTYPYADRFEIHRELPDVGLPREEVLAELRTMATEEDAFWETGKCSGTMYCGDHDHYDFMNEAFGAVRPRERPPARHVPERHQVRGGDHRHDPRPARTARRGGRRGRPVRPGHDRAAPAASCHAVLAYREHAPQTRGVDRPNVIKPETAHPAFDKACHLFGVELRRAPVDPVTTQVDVDWVRRPHRRPDRRPHRLGLQLRLRHRRPDRRPLRPRPRARRRPPRRRLPRRLHPPLRPGARATTSRVFDYRVPGCHLHLGRHPQVRLRLQGHRRCSASATRPCATRSTST